MSLLWDIEDWKVLIEIVWLTLCVFQGHHEVADMWQTSGLQWSEFLSDPDKIDEFLAKHVSSRWLYVGCYCW